MAHVPSDASAWRAAEDALAKAEADLEALAEPYTDAECDRLADIRGDAIDAILALPATTTAQAIRKLELAMFDEQMVRTGVDYPALLADAKRLSDGTAAGVDIEAPFARWKKAWRQSDALGSNAAIEAEIDRCDGEIAANAHLSPRALEIKLWTELAFQFGTEAEHEPLMREDVEGLRAAAHAEPAGADFLELVTLETIEALRRMTPGRGQ